MIAGHRHDRLATDRRVHRAGHAGEIDRQVHQIAKGPMRQGKLVKSLLCPLPVFGILRKNLFQRSFQCSHIVPVF